MAGERQVKVAKLHIKNFLSLRDVELELSKLNVFVGLNSSGKSNIIRALQLLANHVKQGVPVLPEYPEYRGFKNIVHNFDVTGQVELEIEAEISGHSMRYALILTSDNYIEKAWIESREALRSEGRKPVAAVLTRDGVVKDFLRPEVYPLPPHYLLTAHPIYRSAFSVLPSEAAKELHQLAEMLKSFTIHSFNPKSIRAASKVRDSPELGYDGSGLVRVLLYLYLENRKVFAEVEDVLRSLIPEVEEIIPHIEGENVELWLRVKGLREPLKPANISDGTLRILAYITALHSSTSLAAFEEPENFVHPHLLETIVDLARKAPCQVLMTTHSPYLLDHVKPEEVFVVEKPGTETVVRKLSKTREVEAVKKLLEEGGTLGEAWYSGLIGGVPKG